MKFKNFWIFGLVLVGCAQSSGVLRTGPDSYTVSVHAAPARGGEPAARKMALTEANEHCTKIGKEIMVSNISSAQASHSSGGIVGIDFACLNSGDEGLKRSEFKKSDASQ